MLGRRNNLRRKRMEVLEAIKTRRSIRKYKTIPLDDKTIELVLEAARWAPSWREEPEVRPGKELSEIVFHDKYGT